MSWQAGVRLKVGQDNSWTNFSHCRVLSTWKVTVSQWKLLKTFISNIGLDTTLRVSMTPEGYLEPN